MSRETITGGGPTAALTKGCCRAAVARAVQSWCEPDGQTGPGGGAWTQAGRGSGGGDGRLGRGLWQVARQQRGDPSRKTLGPEAETPEKWARSRWPHWRKGGDCAAPPGTQAENLVPDLVLTEEGVYHPTPPERGTFVLPGHGSSRSQPRRKRWHSRLTMDFIPDSDSQRGPGRRTFPKISTDTAPARAETAQERRKTGRTASPWGGAPAGHAGPKTAALPPLGAVEAAGRAPRCWGCGDRTSRASLQRACRVRLPGKHWRLFKTESTPTV